MTIVAAFLFNAALNFALGLAVAKFLGPEEFGRYGIAMAVAVVINSVFFEWLRLSATRFYSEARRHSDPGIRGTLELAYAAISLGLAAVVGATFLSGADLGLPTTLLAAAVAAAIGMGFFDYQAALARARFLERTYAELVLLKNAAAFALMVGGAWLFHNPALVLAGAAVSAAAAILVMRRALADPRGLPSSAERHHFKSFAAYALPLVAANVLYQLIPLANRSVLAKMDGYAEAGQFSLAADLGLRVFMTLGSALDILLFQIAVRIEESQGRKEAERRIATNLALVIAVLLPCAAGLWLVLPALESLVVPAAFRARFGEYTATLIPALVAFALIQYALNPVFQLRKQTAPVVVAALVGLCLDLALLRVLPGAFGPIGVAWAQVAGMVAAATIVATRAARSGGLVAPWRDLVLAAAATAAMTIAILPLRSLEPALAVPSAIIAGAAIYGSLAYAFDIAALRTLSRARLARGRARPVPAE